MLAMDENTEFLKPNSVKELGAWYELIFFKSFAIKPEFKT